MARMVARLMAFVSSPLPSAFPSAAQYRYRLLSLPIDLNSRA